MRTEENILGEQKFDGDGFCKREQVFLKFSLFCSIASCARDWRLQHWLRHSKAALFSLETYSILLSFSEDCAMASCISDDDNSDNFLMDFSSDDDNDDFLNAFFSYRNASGRWDGGDNACSRWMMRCINDKYDPWIQNFQSGFPDAALGRIHSVMNKMLKRLFNEDFSGMQLHIACMQGRKDIVIELLEKGADPTTPTRKGKKTPLHFAAENGNLDVVNALLKFAKSAESQVATKGLKKELNVEAEDSSGMRPLHIAALHGHNEVVEALLEKGADPAKSTSKGNKTPLHYAAESGNDDVVCTVLKFAKAAVPGSTRSARALPADSAQVTVPVNIEQLVNARDKMQRTPLHYGARKGASQVAQALLENGARKLETDKFGAIPFHFASRSGGVDILEKVRVDDDEVGVDRKTTPQKWTALHFAAANGQIDAVEWLLDRGAKMNEADWNGNTPLHWAAVRGKIDVVKHLASKGAPFCHVNEEGEMPWSCGGDKEAIEALLSSFDIAPEKINVDVVDAQDSKGRTLLHVAAEHGHCQAIKWLLNKGANPKQADRYGDTPLHYAAKEGRKKAAQILLEKKVKLNARNKEGCTPLSYALLHNHPHLVKFFADDLSAKISVQPLVRALETELGFRPVSHDTDRDFVGASETEDTEGVSLNDAIRHLPTYMALHAGKDLVFDFFLKRTRLDVNWYDPEFQRTCLHWAALFGKKGAVLKLMKEKDLKHNAKDVFGKTALQYAFDKQNTEIQKLLLKKDKINLKAYEDSMYRDRQVYVDAANAILVGGALIASVTFAGWLQPPLGYTQYYDLPMPFPAPPGMFQSYAGVEQHKSVRVFWACNSLAFFFAMATVLAGTGAVLPMRESNIAVLVVKARRALVMSAILFVLSVMFVLCAFGAAGTATLPPIFGYEANMVGTMIAGGIMCSVLIFWFFWRLYRCRSSPLGFFGRFVRWCLDTVLTVRDSICYSRVHRSRKRSRHSQRFELWDAFLITHTNSNQPAHKKLSRRWKASIDEFEQQDLPLKNSRDE